MPNPVLRLSVATTVLGPDSSELKTWGIEVNLSAEFSALEERTADSIKHLPWRGQVSNSPTNDKDPEYEDLSFQVWRYSPGQAGAPDDWVRIAPANIHRDLKPKALGTKQDWDPAGFRADLRAAVERLKWQACVSPTDETVDQTKQPELAILPGAYGALLLRLSRLPAPIPQTLGLQATLTVTLDAPLPAHSKLWVLPILGCPRLGTLEPDLPNGNPTTIADGLFLYKPLSDPKFDIQAMVLHVTEAPTFDPAIEIIDRTTLWIRSQDNPLNLQDWLPRYRRDVARFLDLPLLLRQALRSAVDSGPGLELLVGLSRKQVLNLRTLMLASLRDQVGFGADTDNQYVPLLDMLLRTLRRDDPAMRNALAKAAGDAATLDLVSTDGRHSWLGLLREALPALADTVVLDSSFYIDSKTVRNDNAAAWEQEVSQWGQLHAAVREAGAVSEISLAQWSWAVATQGTSSLQNLWQEKASDIRGFFQGSDLRTTLESWLLDRTWQGLLPSPAAPLTREELAQRLKARLESYFNSRRDPTTPSDPWKALVPLVTNPLDATLVTLLATQLSSQVDAFLAAAIPTEDLGTDRIASRSLTISVDRLGTESDFDAFGAKDHAHSLAGIGLLLRRRSSQPVIGGSWEPWRCASLADLHPGLADKSSTYLPVALAPRSLSDVGGIRQFTVTYENAPVVAANPLGKSKGRSAEAGLFDSLLPIAYGAIDHRRLSSSPDDPHSLWSVLPLLAYGYDYQMAAFVVSNGGSLPMELRESGKPRCRLTPFTAQPAVPKDSVQEFSFRRDDPIAPLRIGRKTNSLDPESIPALTIPRDVYPLARELTSLQGTHDLPLFLLALSLSGDPNTGFSGLVHQDVSFVVRKPAAELRVWEAWVGPNGPSGSNQKLREGVIREINRISADNAGKTKHEVENLSLDDPALTNRLLVVATRVYDFSGGPSEGAELVVAWRVSDIAKPLAPNQSLGINVTIKCVAEPSPVRLTSPAAHAVLLITAPGEIWKLSLCPLVDKSEADLKLTKAIRDSLSDVHHTVPNAASVLCAPPTEFIVESAIGKQGLPQSTEIMDLPRLGAPNPAWRSLLATRVEGDRARLTLDLTGLTPPERRRYFNIRSFAVRRQVWRWDGRPPAYSAGPAMPPLKGNAGLDPIPTSDPYPNITPAMEWEVGSFAMRRDDDVVLSEAEVRLEENPVWDLWDRNHDQDSRAIYYRFAVDAVSRYAGLGDGEQIRRQAHREFTYKTMRATTPWVRAFLPCRPRSAPSQPKVLFAVPLTESYLPPESGIASILVVLNERWFDEAGPAEKLVADVSLVPYAGQYLQEHGPDSIIEGWSPLGTPAQVRLVAEGPLGHTFDLGTDQGRLGASSFVVSIAANGGSVALAPWHSAKVQFRREFESSLVEAGSVPGLQLLSPPTPAHWIQFLPSRDSLDRKLAALQVSTIQLSSLEPRSPTFRDPVVHEKEVLLITRVITDVGGRFGSEVYAGVADFSPSTGSPVALTLLHGSVPTKACSLRMRILGLRCIEERGRDPSLSGRFWTSLFPGLGNGSEEESSIQVTVQSGPRTFEFSPLSKP
jgi:hypothetical protein